MITRQRFRKGPDRLSFVTCAVALLYVVVGLRLVHLYFIERDHLVDVAQKQHQVVIDLDAKRGRILDAKGRELATGLKLPSVYAVPRLIPETDKLRLSTQLAGILDMDVAWVENRLRRDKDFMWLKRNITAEQARRIRKLDEGAIQIREEFRRYYPYGGELAQIVGFTDVDNRGVEGLELAYDRYLTGQNGQRFTKRDALRREVPMLESKTIPKRDGYDLVLNIDQHIQHSLERELDDAFTKWNAEAATAIVMDPKTGRILAMANRPTYDLNTPGEKQIEQLRNRAVTDFYEPGSIFKAITMAAALEEGKITPSSRFFCENGKWRYSRSRTINDVHPYGYLSASEVLVKSSNIGTVKIAELLGDKSLYRYIKRFGFGSLSGIDVKGEVQGIVHPLERWSKISITSVPYGQEVAATALQMVRAISAIANGGFLVTPHVVKEIRDQHGVVIKRPKVDEPKRILSESTTVKLTQMLTDVVETGTGKRAQIKGVKVAGKTGTSQKIDPAGGYSHSHFIGSFVGYAPAEDPQLAMIVMIDDPRPSYYGGTVAGPVFQNVMQEALTYLGYGVETRPQLPIEGRLKTPTELESSAPLLPTRVAA